jgi:radical SAM superfamily enzyme YgiQ (UPF0313 family)
MAVGGALLVQPDTGRASTLSATRAGSEHLGLAYLAAALAASDLDAEVLDLASDPTLVTALLDRAGDGPALVGFSPTSLSAPRAVELSRLVKQASPGTAVAWGGHLASALGADLFDISPDVDVVVDGMAERVIGSLVASLQRDGTIATGPQVLASPHSRLSKEVRVPRLGPGWSSLRPVRSNRAEDYRAHGARALSSVGCPYDCAFCTTPQFSGQRVERRAEADVVDELVDLHDRLGVTQVWFNDDLFVTLQRSSRAWAAGFASALHERLPDLRFRAMVRADTFRSDPELLDHLHECGMNAVFVGLESGDPVGLTALNKRTTVDDNRWIAEALEERGIALQPGFIMFSDDDTVDSLVRNARFLQSVAELYWFRPLSRSVSLFPGSELWSRTTTWDASRSTPFLRMPMFRDASVRALSIAYEQIEEAVAHLDGRLATARTVGGISWDRRRAIGEVVLDVFEGSVRLAAERAVPDDVVAHVLGRLPEVEAVVAQHLGTPAVR